MSAQWPLLPMAATTGSAAPSTRTPCLLVARVHDADAFAHVVIIDRGDEAAGESEDDFDAMPLEHVADEDAAMYDGVHAPARRGGRVRWPGNALTGGVS
jgi:hypothetical protein